MFPAAQFVVHYTNVLFKYRGLGYCIFRGKKVGLIIWKILICLPVVNIIIIVKSIIRYIARLWLIK